MYTNNFHTIQKKKKNMVNILFQVNFFINLLYILGYSKNNLTDVCANEASRSEGFAFSID